ncbi:hypothetical protein B7463_g3055, partial [Scytalidium lignicola]
MRAAQFYGQRDIRISQIPTPVPTDNQVLISIDWCGLCGSDIHEYLTGPSVIPKSGKPHPLTQDVLPVTMGHEFCGRVVQEARDDSSEPKLKIGQAVMVDPRLYCNTCSRCTAACNNGCTRWGFLGLSGGGGGGLSETVAVNAKMCYVLPDSVPLSYAPLIEPLTVACHSVKTSGFGDFHEKSVLIIGGGPIGLAVIFVLRNRGARAVYVSEPTLKRREQTKEFADAVIDPVTENIGERCRQLTAGRGIDVVFDCAGIQKGLDAAMDALGWRGVYVNVAGWEKPCVVPQGVVLFKELTMKGSFSYTDEDFSETVEAFSAGKFYGIEKMVTSRILLEDVVEKGLVELIERKDDHIKILVTPKKENLGN